jgi:hypothetical protein
VGETPRRRSWLDRALGAVGLTRAQPAALGIGCGTTRHIQRPK